LVFQTAQTQKETSEQERLNLQ